MADSPKVKDLLNKAKWRDERRKLRDIILDCGLEERVNWGKLCYAYKDSNVVIIHGMKNHCAIGFFKGALLKDEDGVLVQPGPYRRKRTGWKSRSLKKTISIIPTSYGLRSMTTPNWPKPSRN